MPIDRRKVIERINSVIALKKSRYVYKIFFITSRYVVV